MSQTTKFINPHAKLHFHNYPIKAPTIVKDNIGGAEPIDCVFFARVSKDKGIEDLLEAISIIKRKRASISLTVIGGANASYMLYLKNICTKLQIENNVDFIGFVPTQEDIYKYAIKAKLCVLPTYHDIIPGTIIESMYLKLPVVAYAVGGIPELNEKAKTIILVEKSKINQLAECIINLLTQPEKRRTLAENASKYAHERFNNNLVVPDILKAYKTLIQK